MKITLDLPDNAAAIVTTTLYNEYDGSVTLSTKSITPEDGKIVKIIKTGKDYREKENDDETDI